MKSLLVQTRQTRTGQGKRSPKSDENIQPHILLSTPFCENIFILIFDSYEVSVSLVERKLSENEQIIHIPYRITDIVFTKKISFGHTTYHNKTNSSKFMINVRHLDFGYIFTLSQLSNVQTKCL